jgi:DNA (cytosine-5)-methyltransferase 1
MAQRTTVVARTEAIKAIDLFCGAGGSSWGARTAGVEIVAAFDMWAVAEAVYRDNFPGVKFYSGRIEDHDLDQIVKEVGDIDLIMASPECTNHSVAKGNKPRCEKSKDTALLVVKFAETFRPRGSSWKTSSARRTGQSILHSSRRWRVLAITASPQRLDGADFGQRHLN